MTTKTLSNGLTASITAKGIKIGSTKARVLQTADAVADAIANFTKGDRRTVRRMLSRNGKHNLASDPQPLAAAA